MKIQNVKGGYDYLPQMQQIRDYINEILKSCFESFGYNPIETPILCYYDILSDKYDKDNDILKEIYRLKDQGNRDLGLRYDLTVPFAKFIALNKNNITFPFKRYEISKVFRDGPVKLGRDREFTQCDADVVGLKGQYIESELLSLFKEAFVRLNIEIVINYNNRKLMSGLILESGISKNLLSSVTTIIDKKNKLSEKEFVQNLLEIGVSDEQINKLNEYFLMDIDKLNKSFLNTCNDNIKLGLKEINDLNMYINDLNMGDICKFNVTLARGQSYYTGNVFEVYAKNSFIKGSIAAGGRYDNIIGNFIDDGNVYPTVGISFGLSSIFEIIKDREFTKNTSLIDIYIIPLNTKVQSLKLANLLRQNNIKVEIEMQDKKIKKCLDYANKKKIPYVIILGEEEIATQKIILKDMFGNNNIEISFDEIFKIRDYLRK